MYNCPLGFPDGLSDYGQLLELWVQIARAKQAQLGSVSTEAEWVTQNLPKALALANFTLGLRRNATANTPTSSDFHGLIWG
jgi:hypothetical protein